MDLQVTGRRPLLFAMGLAAAAVIQGAAATRCIAEEKGEKTAAAVSGREIFNREWLPNDPRSHGGDGLGPVFNDSSCVACHNQGGVGGGGPASKNVDIVSAALNNPVQRAMPRQTVIGTLLGAVFGGGASKPSPSVAPTKQQLEQRREMLVKEAVRIHPGFSNARSVVIHKFGVDKDYEPWRLQITGKNQFIGIGFQSQTMVAPGAFIMEAPADLAVPQVEAIAEDLTGPGLEPAAELLPLTPIPGFAGAIAVNGREQSQANQIIAAIRTASFDLSGPFMPGARVEGNFTVSNSQRNPTALFGVGRIDSIPVKVLEEAAARKFEKFPEVTGRVARLPGDKVGKFGWKAQKASLYDFTMTACAVELGLNVPDHPQSGLPSKPEYKPAGYDLNQKECDALVDYLRELPAPAAMQPGTQLHKDYLHEGAKLFASVGCSTCHTENLGEVSAIYSDLLLHDMGPDLGDTGDYGVFIPDSPGGDSESPVPPLAQLEQPQQLRRALPGVPDSQPPKFGAARLEWRTPPLWGVRDSGPYLHDGRAKTLEQAIAFHGGEGQKSAQRYFLLSNEERHKVQAFLKSLVAPTEVAQK